jgi:hypothetical protein
VKCLLETKMWEPLVDDFSRLFVYDVRCVIVYVAGICMSNLVCIKIEMDFYSCTTLNEKISHDFLGGPVQSYYIPNKKEWSYVVEGMVVCRASKVRHHLPVLITTRCRLCLI